MSLAQYVASITVPSIGANGTVSPANSLPFSIARLSAGAVIDRTMVELEELGTPGVDGRRWRQVRNLFQPFNMETWADYSTYGLAIAECRNYWLAQGQFVTLYWTAGGYQGQYFQVKVLDVQAVVMAGVFNGYGSTTGSAAMIRATWSLCVQAAENTQPT